QLFYFYNKLHSIYQKTQQLQILIPHPNIPLPHPQITQPHLDQTMLTFINHHYHILLTTTIIQTRLDLPNPNTLIIQDADPFPLSQL
ncbi:P-loop NTPase family protein, partial [Staphylococcus epidermidis]|uniref:hypothetical protein n=1 Tax=Staphylococcus epidermidis TaxID=1282 RepID=UPI0021B205A7